MKGIKTDNINIDGVQGFQIKIDPIEMHENLREQIDAIQLEIQNKIEGSFQKLIQRFENRFCDICFFGKPVVYAIGEHLCQECADNMYELDNEKDVLGLPIIKKKKSYEWWVQNRRRRVNEALFAAYGELAEYKVKEAHDADR